MDIKENKSTVVINFTFVHHVHVYMYMVEFNILYVKL